MPRLVGKDSSKGLVYAGLVVLLAIAGFTALEYTGTIDVISGFGDTARPLQPERQDNR